MQMIWHQAVGVDLAEIPLSGFLQDFQGFFGGPSLGKNRPPILPTNREEIRSGGGVVKMSQTESVFPPASCTLIGIRIHDS